MFSHDKFSTILRSSSGPGVGGDGGAGALGGYGGGGGGVGVAGPRGTPLPPPPPPPPYSQISGVQPPQSSLVRPEEGDDDSETPQIHKYTPTSRESSAYKTQNLEIDRDIEKQRKNKKKALMFLGIGLFCSVMLGVGLFTNYGPQGFTAMESLEGAKGGALGLETAKLAFGFSAVGFAIPIAMGVISLLVAFASDNKIKKLKRAKELNSQLMSGVSSENSEVMKDKKLQRAIAITMVEEKHTNWTDRVKKAQNYIKISAAKGSGQREGGSPGLQ